jgi:hypothetical protein
MASDADVKPIITWKQVYVNKIQLAPLNRNGINLNLDANAQLLDKI